MLNAQTIEKITQADEVHQQTKNNLLKIFKDDYRKIYHNAIKLRLNDAIYIFDSTPDITYKFVKENIDKISDRSFIERTKEEYFDYKIQKKALDEKRELAYYKKLCQILGISAKDNMTRYEEIINLPIESLSGRNRTLVENSELPLVIKRALLNNQKECISLIRQLGIRKTPNEKAIDKLIYSDKKEQQKNNVKLIKNTIWGHRMQMHIQTRTNKYITNENIAEILYDKEVGTTTMFSFEYPVTIVHVPLMKDVEVYDLDSIYLHETRHVIETSTQGTGIEAKKPVYSILNEVNTEKNSIADSEKLRNEIFTNQNIQDYQNVYKDLFPVCGSFFEDYHQLLNESAVRQDAGFIERIFGKKELINFATNLTDCYEIMDEYYKCDTDDRLVLNGTSTIRQIDQLDNNYQKTLQRRKQKQNPTA